MPPGWLALAHPPGGARLPGGALRADRLSVFGLASADLYPVDPMKGPRCVFCDRWDKPAQVFPCKPNCPLCKECHARSHYNRPGPLAAFSCGTILFGWKTEAYYEEPCIHDPQ